MTGPHPKQSFWLSFIAYVFPAVAFAQGQFPQINPNGVVNAASYTSGPLSPGSTASVFGTNLAIETGAASAVPLPTDINGVTVTLNGTPAPLFFVSPTQINFQVPWELQGQSQVMVRVVSSGQASSAQPVNLAPLVQECSA